MIERAAAGDPAAREAFARDYLGIVRQAFRARWQRSPLCHEVEDAAQEVFLDCLREGGALSRVHRAGPGRFRSWLLQVTLHVARRFEERHRRRVGPVLPEDCTGRDEALSLQFDRAWARRMIRAAVKRLEAEATDALSQRRLAILKLRFGEDLPIREIAERLGLPAARVHHDYADAREAFKRALRAVVADAGGAGFAEVERECRALLSRL